VRLVHSGWEALAIPDAARVERLEEYRKGWDVVLAGLVALVGRVLLHDLVRDAHERATRLLHDVDLDARVHHYPSQLSGGEQQRVALARALANEPKVLLADEPTGNLDSNNGQHVIDLLFDVNRARQTTLVLVTHDRELAAKADVQIVMRDGAVVERIERQVDAPAGVR